MQEAEGRFGRGTHFKRVNQYVNVTEEETPLPLPKKKKKEKKRRWSEKQKAETNDSFISLLSVGLFFFLLPSEGVKG